MLHRDIDPSRRKLRPMTCHCEQRPDLWQVKFDFHGGLKESAPVYFLVRWQPPFHFTLVDLGNRPWPDCTQPDYKADRCVTLFG